VGGGGDPRRLFEGEPVVELDPLDDSPWFEVRLVQWLTGGIVK
jgi:hypothetical protein